MTIEQRLDLEREDRRRESTQARLGGRRKFAMCRRCGSNYGMQNVHRDTLAEMPLPTLNWIKSRKFGWYRELDNDEYLFYPCSTCNPGRVVPDGFMAMHDIQAWLDRDPMALDYEALAAKPVAATAAEDSRAAAGLEG